MKERPIVFSGSMVRAILNGRKTQTRRIVKKGVVGRLMCGNQKLWPYSHYKSGSFAVPCPYGQPGDRLWVRETWGQVLGYKEDADTIFYKADNTASFFRDEKFLEYWNGIDAQNELICNCEKWRPSIYMPRWASRIMLEIVNIRVERLQDMSNGDAIAEGIHGVWQAGIGPVDCYAEFWDDIHGPGSWEKNPWVWVIEFRGVK